MNVRAKLAVGALLLGLLAGAYWLLHETGAMTTILDTNALHERVLQMGPWGPAAIIALMVLAILILCVFPEIATWLPARVMG